MMIMYGNFLCCCCLFYLKVVFFLYLLLIDKVCFLDVRWRSFYNLIGWILGIYYWEKFLGKRYFFFVWRFCIYILVYWIYWILDWILFCIGYNGYCLVVFFFYKYFFGRNIVFFCLVFSWGMFLYIVFCILGS